MFGGGQGRQETKSGENSASCVLRGDPAAIRADAEGGKAEPGGRNAGDIPVSVSVGDSIHTGAIPHQPCLGVRLFPKKLERPMGEVVEKGLVIPRELRRAMTTDRLAGAGLWWYAP